MTPHGVGLTEDIEYEGRHIIVEGLMVEKQLGQKAEVLTVELQGGG